MKLFNVQPFVLQPDNPKETLEFLDFVFAGFEAEKAITEDKKFTAGDILHIMKAGPAAFRGFIGIKYVDDELRAMSEIGRQMVTDKIKSFIYDDERTENFVELVLEWLLLTVRLADEAIQLIKDDGEDVQG